MKEEKLQEAKRLYESANADQKYVLESLFPELAGSEDEQIRKELTKHLKEGVEGYMPAGDSSDYRRWLDWLEKQGKSSDQIHYWTEEEIEPIISDYLRGAEHYGGMIARLRCLKPKSLEKQSEFYTKRDVDNAYIEGMASAKRELEKQGEQKHNPCDECINVKGCINCENGELRETEQKPADKVEPKFKVGDRIIGVVSSIPYFITEVCDDYYNTESGCIIMFCAQDNFKLYEQNPIDKVEPKFKVGDWIISKYMYLVMQILNNDKGSYKTVETDGTERNDSYDFIERNFKLWTIQDAKDGDVLADDNGSICIFDGTVEEDIYPFAYCGLTRYGFESYDRKLPFTHYNNVYPASKEQRNLLFSKMKEAGYKWDANKKELKKIDARENLTLDGDLMEADCMIVEQNSSWTKEDEKIFDRICALIHSAAYKNYDVDKDGNECGEYANIKEWFKKLKDRVQPQITWKPSDEQMATLYKYAEQNNYDGSILTSLYNDLKKLREE